MYVAIVCESVREEKTFFAHKQNNNNNSHNNEIWHNASIGFPFPLWRLKFTTLFFNIFNICLQIYSSQVNHKMNSYTISALAPDTVYSVMLCLDKNSHKIPISKLEIRTRPKSYMVQLGIVKDYTAIIAGIQRWWKKIISMDFASFFQLFLFWDWLGFRA